MITNLADRNDLKMRIERTKNAIRNVTWGYIYKMVNIILPFIFRSVMIKVLGADYLGINSLFTSILQILSLSELGFGTAIVYNMYKPIAENDIQQINALLYFYKRIYYIIGSVIMVAGLIIMPLIPYLISGYNPSNINIYFVYLMFLLNTSISYYMFAYRGSLLNAFQRNDVESKVLIIVSVFRYIIEIGGIILTKQYYIFLCIEILSTVLNNLLKYRFTKKMYPQFSPIGNIDTSTKKQIKDDVLALMCHKIGGIVLNSADNIVLSIFMGVIIVANYSNYYYIMNAISSIITTCFAGITAGIGNSFVTESPKKNRDDFKKILFFNAWIVIWCSTCLLCLYQDFMFVWVGEEYMFSNEITILFVIYFFVHSIRRTILIFRDGAGMWCDNKWQPIVSGITNLIINIILVQYIGVYGILISSISSMILIDIPWETSVFCSKIDMRNSQYLGQLVLYFIIAVLVGSITWLITLQLNFMPILNLLIKGIICIFAPNIILILILHRCKEFKFFLHLTKKYTGCFLHKGF